MREHEEGLRRSAYDNRFMGIVTLVDIEKHEYVWEGPGVTQGRFQTRKGEAWAAGVPQDVQIGYEAEAWYHSTSSFGLYYVKAIEGKKITQRMIAEGDY